MACPRISLQRTGADHNFFFVGRIPAALTRFGVVDGCYDLLQYGRSIVGFTLTATCQIVVNLRKFYGFTVISTPPGSNACFSDRIGFAGGRKANRSNRIGELDGRGQFDESDVVDGAVSRRESKIGMKNNLTGFPTLLADVVFLLVVSSGGDGDLFRSESDRLGSPKFFEYIIFRFSFKKFFLHGFFFGHAMSGGHDDIALVLICLDSE